METPIRCPWALEPAEYRRYHDEEWGRPVTDDRAIFEKLCLEGFQAGLSWLTILRKRPAFRAAFAHFDPAVVASFGAAEVAGLLADPGIVRHRAKIEATIGNARATLDLRERGESLAAVLWSYRVADRPAPEALADLPATTPEAIALSQDLRRRGFRFLGPTTAYAAMQSLGVVNDHLASCFVRPEVDAQHRAVPGR